MNCDNCKWHRWYYDRCEKWKCEMDAREIHNCFEPMGTPIKALCHFPLSDEPMAKSMGT